MKLRDIAHARTGDKGNISIISLIAYDRKDFEVLKRVATEERIAAYFQEIVQGKVTRYELPALGALNIVMENALGGGVTRSLAIDMHGKTLGFALLEMEFE